MSIDWHKIFVPDQPILEGVIRGTLVYLMLFLIFRFLMRRRARGLAIADVLVIVLIADASQNAMGSEYKSVTEGAALVLTIVCWDRIIDWLGDRVRWLRPLVRTPPLPLIKNGSILRANMKDENITPDELFSELRKQGFTGPDGVQEAFLEGDGTVSIIAAEHHKKPSPEEGKDPTS